MKLRTVEIENINDDLLLPWLDLYESAFPECEKVPVSSHLKILKERACGETSYNYLIAALNEYGDFAGLARFSFHKAKQFAYLWYLAVMPQMRNLGIGAQVYKDVYERSKAEGLDALLFEVEIPAETASKADAEFARRRIGFYRRLGARMLTGIHYLQSAGPDKPKTPMHIMIHSIKPITPQEAYNMAEYLFEDSITMTGIIRLE